MLDTGDSADNSTKSQQKGDNTDKDVRDDGCKKKEGIYLMFSKL